ncbi:polyamine ABC transporter substrate-binding protein [Vibrio ponticus]|nr:spermidine/putrescine ABC transporter substrate-binding protein [Vibrio ponticus]
MTIRQFLYCSLWLLPSVSFTLAAQQLNILMWENTLSQQVIEQWQQETGITLQITHFDSNDERDTLLSSNERLLFDVMVLDNISTNVFGSLGKLTSITGVNNRKHHDAFWNNACGEYGQPYFWGSIGVVYRSDIVKTPPSSWQEFITPDETLSGHIGLLNDTTDSFLPFLLSLGISPDTSNPEVLHQSYQTMREFNKHILTYQYPLSFIAQAEESDQLYIAMAYSGDQHLLNQQQHTEHWQYKALTEKPNLWLDCLAINRKSDKQPLALSFIDYISDPKVAAINATEIKAATTNRSALKLVPDWYANDALLNADTTHFRLEQLEQTLSAKNISLRAKILSQLLIEHETQH